MFGFEKRLISLIRKDLMIEIEKLMTEVKNAHNKAIDDLEKEFAIDKAKIENLIKEFNQKFIIDKDTTEKEKTDSEESH